MEIYSNLFAISRKHWELYCLPGVSLATSYYSDQADEHDQVTQRPGSHVRTRSNIIEALRRSIPLRVGIVDTLDGQRVEQAREELRALGIARIGTDWVRGIGRAARMPADVSQLCGKCARTKVARRLMIPTRCI